ncbi:hypothetical protein Ahy_A07g036242 [Arachis hypogaea]|uniref:B box-type domain-containing protein n=3 Tax=Arachis hypogaea TaxID=3818 RepID=A0A445CFL4_ARAHY|nr:B-box zinc finger protein 20 isoform X1 [Arachis hypogaea]RYR49706.1 hypothetical protein Ahy_A07g036242 [Arachis hypogaea]
MDPNAKSPIIVLSPFPFPFISSNTNLNCTNRQATALDREMKIQCDACDKDEASLFCPADEAALCHACDLTIHHANKLAIKHTRFTLHQPSSKDIPRCDICQERRAYLFCKEDRAILCRECDVPIHKANEHTQNHSRFLLTGVKLSGSSLDTASSSSVTSSTEARSSRSRMKRPTAFNNEHNMSAATTSNSDTGSASSSSISKFLIETIPGYCFEDLLDASFPHNNGFCKNQHLMSVTICGYYFQLGLFPRSVL